MYFLIDGVMNIYGFYLIPTILKDKIFLVSIGYSGRN